MVLSGQSISVGVEAGVPAQPAITYQTSKLPFAIGPTVNIRISSAWSVDSGVLFHRLGESSQNASFLGAGGSYVFSYYNVRGRAIEVPVQLRNTLLNERRSLRPFVSAGAAVRRTSQDFNGFQSVLSGAPIAGPLMKNTIVKWNVDPVITAGLSFGARRMRIEPQVRYTYWGAGKSLEVRKNQANFILGLRF